MESEKINVPSSENDFTLLSVEKEKDSAATKLMPPKETSPSSELSLAKIHDPVDASQLKKSHWWSLKQTILNQRYPKLRQTNWNLRKSI